MKKLFAAGLIAALPLLLGAALKVPAIPVPAGAVEIYNAGSADFTGFRIVVERSGKAWSVDGAGRARGLLEPGVTAALFADVGAARPLSQLPKQACAQSQTDASTAQLSANASVVVALDGDRSPDLRCSTDPRAVALLAAAQAVERALYVQAYRVRPGIMMFGGAGNGTVTGGSSPPAQPPPSNPAPGYPRMYPGWEQ